MLDKETARVKTEWDAILFECTEESPPILCDPIEIPPEPKEVKCPPRDDPDGQKVSISFGEASSNACVDVKRDGRVHVELIALRAEPVPNCDDFPCGKEGNKVLICHVPPGKPENARTVCIDPSEVPARVTKHGSSCGPCP